MLLILPYFLALLYWVLPPVSTLMIRDMVTYHMPKREWVPLSDVSPHVMTAVIASEDSAFCEHFGFDFNQIEKAVDSAAKGRKLRGASTITMQTAKNLFLWNGRSWLRKLLEAPLTLWLELIWSKRRIIEVYLNVAEWGPGLYGVQAASEHYFHVPASTLSSRQAAVLVAMLPNPKLRKNERTFPWRRASMIEQQIQRYGVNLSCVP